MKIKGVFFVKTEYKLSENEQQIMETLWREGRSLLRSEIIDLTVDKTWKKSSIHILLNQLLDKNAIKVDGFEKSGTNYGRTYSPTITKEEFDLMEIKGKFNQIKPSKEVIENFLCNLVETDQIDSDLLEKLQGLIDSKGE